MTEQDKRWQTTIWVGAAMDQPTLLYGETITSLKKTVADWLRENQPSEFGNTPPTSELRHRSNYAYSDGTKRAFYPLSAESNKVLEQGWHFADGRSPYAPTQNLGDFPSAINHFLGKLHIEKGPDYRDIPLQEGEIPLGLIKTVRRENDVDQVNMLLRRGWYLITIEFDGQQEYPDGKIVSRKARFVLGHPEHDL